MKQEELLTACPTIVSASFLLTLEELTLLRLLSQRPWLPSYWSIDGYVIFEPENEREKDEFK